MRQVIVNLISNSIKFTESGEVVLDVALVDSTKKDVAINFTVSDSGIGISQDKLGTIFSEFEQADTSTTRRYGGTGLGLAIASRLVDLMGGKLEVSSELGKGSIFTFSIPTFDPPKILKRFMARIEQFRNGSRAYWVLFGSEFLRQPSSAPSGRL